MATKVHVQLVDDLDGSPASQTVRFALDGKDFEIDLNDENAAQLRGIFVEFKDAARRAGASRTTARAAASPVDTKAVRAWAESQGIQVNPRGRISQHVIAQYTAAN